MGDNQNYVTCAKGFLDSSFNYAVAVVDRISPFHEAVPYFTYKNVFFFFFKREWDRPMLLPYKIS